MNLLPGILSNGSVKNPCESTEPHTWGSSATLVATHEANPLNAKSSPGCLTMAFTRPGSSARCPARCPYCH